MPFILICLISISDRLFATFDTKHSNFVSFDDFVCGLAICSRYFFIYL